VLNLRVRLEEGEKLCLGESVPIEMMDGSFRNVEIKIINPKYAGDFAWVSQKAAAKVKSGEFGMSDERVLKIEGPCSATLVITDVPYHDIKTEEEIESRKLAAEIASRVCLTPYRELHSGEESIFDHIQEDYCVPNRVIAYLRTTQPYLMSPGIYKHPFKSEIDLLGPYMYTDGKYYWDRDTWKYVLKYHVTLPQEFVDHVMSENGEAFLNSLSDQPDSWPKTIQQWKKEEGWLCLLPDNAGEIELKEF